MSEQFDINKMQNMKELQDLQKILGQIPKSWVDSVNLHGNTLTLNVKKPDTKTYLSLTIVSIPQVYMQEDGTVKAKGGLNFQLAAMEKQDSPPAPKENESA
jgi:hypothetical protein|tara:strand:+ start:4843 stop:5145 length:303 start_codon:yes stop_codon:yes gene_type:complete